MNLSISSSFTRLNNTRHQILHSRLTPTSKNFPAACFIVAKKFNKLQAYKGFPFVNVLLKGKRYVIICDFALTVQSFPNGIILTEKELKSFTYKPI